MTWATAALMAAGTTAQYMGNQKSKKAMDEMQALEAARQKKLQGKSDELLGDSLKRSDAATAEADIQDASAKRQAAYDQVLPPPSSQEKTLTDQLGVSADNKVIGNEVSARNAQADNSARSLAAALANLGGGTDQTLNTAILNNRALVNQQQVGNFMQGSANVLPFENQAAHAKGDNLRGIGDILNAAAMVTGTMAATGYNPFAGATPPVYTPGTGMPLYKTAATAAPKTWTLPSYLPKP